MGPIPAASVRKPYMDSHSQATPCVKVMLNSGYCYPLGTDVNSGSGSGIFNIYICGLST